MDVPLTPRQKRLAKGREAAEIYTLPSAKHSVPQYRNIFTTTRDGKLPLVLKDGTSVEFPSDWTKKDAENWRHHANLEPPPRGSTY